MGRVLLKMTHPIRKDSEGEPWLFSSSWDIPPPCLSCITGNISQLRESMDIIQSLETELFKA